MVTDIVGEKLHDRHGSSVALYGNGNVVAVGAEGIDGVGGLNLDTFVYIRISTDPHGFKLEKQ